MLLPLFAFASIGLLSANEDHLLMIPTPIGEGDQIYIVHKSMVSGYGADFEGSCDRISAAYMGDVRSPSSEISEADMNPVGLAKIELSAVLPPNNDNFYKVTIDYRKATEDSTKDVRLLRAILTCIHMFGDSLHGYLKLKANFVMIGIDAKSTLHAELTRFIDERKQKSEKFEKTDAGQPPTRAEFEWPAF